MCFYVSGDHRDLHVLTHSFPTRRSSDLPTSPHGCRANGSLASAGAIASTATRRNVQYCPFSLPFQISYAKSDSTRRKIDSGHRRFIARDSKRESWSKAGRAFIVGRQRREWGRLCVPV